MKRWRFLLTPILLLMLLSVILLIKDPAGRTLRVFFIDPLRVPHLLGQTLNQTFLLLLPALAIVLSFGTGSYNLGGEGQIYLGGMISWWFLFHLQGLPPALAWFCSWTLGALAGSGITALAWVLKKKGGVNELISTYLLSLGILTAVDGWITGPAKDSNSYLMTTAPIAEAHRLHSLLPPSRLNGSIFLILMILLAAYLFLYRRQEGYYWRLTGVNPLLGQYVGCHTEKIQRRALILSGGLHGLTGALIITGQSYMALQGFSAGLGWDGMAVALMAGLHPLGLLPAGLFFALLKTGANQAHLTGLTGLNMKGVVLALIFFLSTSPLMKLQKREADRAL